MIMIITLIVCGKAQEDEINKIIHLRLIYKPIATNNLYNSIIGWHTVLTNECMYNCTNTSTSTIVLCNFEFLSEQYSIHIHLQL